MWHFLQAHPSIFIIVATIVIIIIIFAFFTKKSIGSYTTEIQESRNYVELQELSTETRSDETDYIETFKNQRNRVSHTYDSPRAQEFATIPEIASDESSTSFSYVPARLFEPSTSGSNGNSSVTPINRISGDYVKFDTEFDHFDEFRKSCVNTVRLTVDFGANNDNYIVPVTDK